MGITNDLVISAGICTWSIQPVKFLTYVITSDGIERENNKFDTIQSWHIP
jgi:hypothetical protein